MENKKVGYILIGISVLIILIILLFNSALKDIVSVSCGEEHSIVCPMNQTINQQTYIALGVVGLLIIVALILIFSKPEERIVVKKVMEKQKKKEYDLSGLRAEDKTVFKLIQDNKAMFQSDLIERTGFGKAKMSRIIDRLEGNGFVERKRRGMTNVVVLKED